MKRTVFLLIGSFIGAGFISGREIAEFYCKDGRLSEKAYLTFILFFLFVYLLLNVGKRCGGFNGFNGRNYGTWRKIISILYGISSIISASAMASGCEALINSFYGIYFKIPIFAILMIAISMLSAIYGLNLLKIINAVLVPVMVIGIVYIVFMHDTGEIIIEKTKSNTVSVYLYVGMNIWFSAPLIMQSGINNTNKKNILSAFFTSAIITFLIVIVSLKITGKSELLNEPMPLLHLAKGSVIKETIYLISTILAIYTTMSSSMYSMKNIFIKGNHVPQKTVILSAVIFAVSLFGFSNIVERLYPVIGVIGLTYVFSVYCVKSGFKYKKGKILQQ